VLRANVASDWWGDELAPIMSGDAQCWNGKEPMTFKTQMRYLGWIGLCTAVLYSVLLFVLPGYRCFSMTMVGLGILAFVIVRNKRHVVVDGHGLTIDGVESLTWNETQDVLKHNSWCIVFRMKSGATKRILVLDWPTKDREAFLDFIDRESPLAEASCGEGR